MTQKWLRRGNYPDEGRNLKQAIGTCTQIVLDLVDGAESRLLGPGIRRVGYSQPVVDSTAERRLPPGRGVLCSAGRRQVSSSSFHYCRLVVGWEPPVSATSPLLLRNSTPPSGQYSRRPSGTQGRRSPSHLADKRFSVVTLHPIRLLTAQFVCDTDEGGRLRTDGTGPLPPKTRMMAQQVGEDRGRPGLFRCSKWTHSDLSRRTATARTRGTPTST